MNRLSEKPSPALRHLVADKMDASRSLLALWDADDRLIYANHAFRDWFFVGDVEVVTFPELTRRNWERGRGPIVGGACFEDWLQKVLTRRRKDPFAQFEVDFYDGRWLLVCETNDASGCAFFVGMETTAFHGDSHDLVFDRELALRAARVDDLTALANRRFALQQLDTLLATDAGRPDRGCVAIIDIDHFKSINDTYGHPVGDAVLIAVANRLRSSLSLRATSGRMGGEEFMLILPNVTLGEAAATTKLLLMQIAGDTLLPDFPALSVTCSAGLTPLLAGDSSDAVYMRADAALYRAKRSGRNRCELSLPDEDDTVQIMASGER